MSTWNQQLQFFSTCASEHEYQSSREGKGFNDTLNICLNPEEALPVTIRVDIPDISSTGALSGWLVTARGNLVSLEKEKTVVTAQVAQGIGSLTMDFATFRYYEVEDNVLKNPTSGFNVPSGDDIVFAVLLTNLDPDERPIELNSHSSVWVYYPDQAASDGWKIINVHPNGTILPFSPIYLEFNTQSGSISVQS